MKPTLSEDYQAFQKHVFGDYRYYHHNGLPEEICTRLVGAERERAEKLVLQAIKKRGKDERSIKAAGYLKIRSAAPILEAILSKTGTNSQGSIRISCAWAFFKIKGDKKYMDVLTDEVSNTARLDAATRCEALTLLSDFGKEHLVIEVLLRALLDKNVLVSQSAHFALLKMFQGDYILGNLLKERTYAVSSEGWDRIVREAQMRLLP